MEIHFSMEPELFLLSNPLFFKVYHGIPYVTVTDVIIFQKWNSIDYHKAIYLDISYSFFPIYEINEN